MKITAYPIKKVFKDSFPQNLESLFLKEDIVFVKSSNKDIIIAEAINAFIKLIKLVKHIKALLANINGQLSIKSQDNQAEIFHLSEASNLVKIKRTLDKDDKNISYYWLKELNYQFHNKNGENVSLVD